MEHILSWIVFLPTIAAVFCLVVPKDVVKWLATVATGLTFLLSLLLFPTFLGGGDAARAPDVFGQAYGFLHHVVRADWIAGNKFTIEYFVGIDGLSFPLVVLTTFVTFLACIASLNFEKWTINRGIRAYVILFLLLEPGRLGVYVSLDFF